ncbi:MAG: rhomboid family intramembrane serine protease [Chloroflexota bacterium]
MNDNPPDFDAGGRPQPPPPRYVTLPTVRPFVTYVLFGLNILIFLLQSLTGRDLWFYYGAKINEFIIAGEWWRLVTPMFLHAGLAHIAFNSYALYIFGKQVEALFGHRRFLIIYLLSGIAGSVLSFAMSPSPSVGASGAICGLIGALLIYLYRHRQLFGERGRRQLMQILAVAGINLVIGLSPGIDNWGHVGGLIGGVVLTWLIGPIHTLEREPPGDPFIADRNRLGLPQWLAVFAVALALGAITSVVAALQR